MDTFLIFDLNEILINCEQFAMLAKVMHFNHQARAICKSMIRTHFMHEFRDRQPSRVIAQGDRHIQIWDDRFGHIHRAYDQPAVICSDGTREWRVHGILHRGTSAQSQEPLPAVIWGRHCALSETREWYTYGQFNKSESRHFICDGGNSFYYFYNKFHCDNCAKSEC